MMEHVQTLNLTTKFYKPPQKRSFSVSIPMSIHLKPRIIRIRIHENSTEVKMGPEWYQHDNYDTALRNIVYPKQTKRNEQRTFNTIARYRASIHKHQNNFQKEPLKVDVDNIEALIIALDQFVQRFGGELSFTDQEIPFDNAADSIACGIANMDNIHLVAANFIPTAQFSFKFDKDYHRDIARSDETIQTFLLQFSNAIVDIVTCPKEYLRITSIEQLTNTRTYTKINFGFTTPNLEQTKKYAEDLKSQAQKSFRKHPILRYVLPDKFKYQWKSQISFLQIRTIDFTRKKQQHQSHEFTHGWHSYQLYSTEKYNQDNSSFPQNNLDKECPVAFIRTNINSINEINQTGVLFKLLDTKRKKPLQECGPKYDKDGYVVPLRWINDVHPQYTITSDYIKTTANNTQSYQLVFQCSIKPDTYILRLSQHNEDHTLHFTDPQAIHPYALLIKCQNDSTHH